MTAKYKNLEKGGEGESMMSPFSDDPKADHTFVEVPPALSMAKARYGQQPDDHLLLAILTTVFCCIPCGIAAIVKSVDVRNKWVVGDIIGANQSSRAAKRYSICSLVCGVIVLCTYFGLLVAGYIYFMSAMQEINQMSQTSQMDQENLFKKLGQLNVGQQPQQPYVP